MINALITRKAVYILGFLFICMAVALSFPSPSFGDQGTVCFSDGCVYFSEDNNGSWFGQTANFATAAAMANGIYNAHGVPGVDMSGVVWDALGRITQIGCGNGVYASVSYVGDGTCPAGQVGAPPFCAASAAPQSCPSGYVYAGGQCVCYTNAWGNSCGDGPQTVSPGPTTNCTPAYMCSGNTIQYLNSSCLTSTIAVCAAPSFCSAGSPQCLYPSASFNETGSGRESRSGHLQVIPTLVSNRDTTRVFWNVSNVASCSVTGSNGDHWDGLSSGQDGKISSPLTAVTTYTLDCAVPGGTAIHETQVVNILPSFQEL